MKLFVVFRNDDVGYDEFNSFVCLADSASKALKMHPTGNRRTKRNMETWTEESNLEAVEIDQEISGVILASFRAG
jgi:hypothetical protein